MRTAPLPDLSTLCTPSELAILLADRLVLSFPDRFLGGLEVPGSRRFVGTDVLLPVVVETALAALRQCGAVTLTLHSRGSSLDASELPWLTARDARPAFLQGSPEAKLLEWLGTRPGRCGFVDDAIADALIHTVSPDPWRCMAQQAMSGLLARGVCVEQRRTVWVVFRETTLALHDTVAGAVAPQATTLLSLLANTRALLTPKERALVGRCVSMAVSAQTAR
jgi:hypothetical protein